MVPWPLDALEGLHGRHAGVGREFLLNGDDLGDAINHLLHELDLGEADALLVADVPLGPDGGRVLARGPAGLEVKLVANLLEHVGVLVELWELDHDRGAEPGAEVGGAGAQEPEAVALHQLGAVGDGGRLDRVADLAKARENGPNVAPVLHRDDAAVVLLIAPRERSLGVVMEDAPVVGPVARGSSDGEELCWARLLEEEAVGLEHVLVGLGESPEGVVLALELPVKRGKRLLEHVLNARPLLGVGAAGEREARDVARGANAGRHHVLVKEDLLPAGEGEVLGVQVALVRLGVGVKLVPPLHNRVDHLLEHLKTLLVPRSKAHPKVRPQHPRLHPVRQRVPLAALHVLELLKQLSRHRLAHQRLVQVREGRELAKRQVPKLLRVLGVRRRRVKLPLKPRVKPSLNLRQAEANRPPTTPPILGRELLLHRNDLGDPVNHLLHKLNLAKADPLLVRNVPLATNSRAVLPRRPPRLQVKPSADLLKLVHVLVQLRKNNHHRRAQPSPKVRGARPKKAKLLVVHQRLAVGLRSRLDRVRQRAEAPKHPLDVPAVLHRNDPALVLLVAPAKHSLGLVVEDPAPLGPVPARTRRPEQLHRAGLLEQEAPSLQGSLLLGRQPPQGIVGALELRGEALKGLLEHALDREAVLLTAPGGERVPGDVARGAHASRLDILLKEGRLLLCHRHLGGVQVALVLLRGGVELVPPLHDGVDDLLEELEALLVAGGEAHPEVRPQHAGLHAVGQRVALAALDSLELLEELRREYLAHQRLVGVREGGELRESDVLELVRVLLVGWARLELRSQPRVERVFDLRQLEPRNHLRLRGHRCPLSAGGAPLPGRRLRGGGGIAGCRCRPVLGGGLPPVGSRLRRRCPALRGWVLGGWSLCRRRLAPRLLPLPRGLGRCLLLGSSRCLRGRLPPCLRCLCGRGLGSSHGSSLLHRRWHCLSCVVGHLSSTLASHSR
mmetsp:Transcript_31910/g.81188  ORF Transcript_31910/g.81188 Transcript_31910/m.81188 type:complete len:956 (-) Transcript_31910:17-2884(-)